ncbi:hypothetical protein ACHAWF_005261, partial [Thalassiosira exigua]
PVSGRWTTGCLAPPPSGGEDVFASGGPSGSEGAFDGAATLPSQLHVSDGDENDGATCSEDGLADRFHGTSVGRWRAGTEDDGREVEEARSLCDDDHTEFITLPPGAHLLEVDDSRAEEVGEEYETYAGDDLGDGGAEEARSSYDDDRTEFITLPPLAPEEAGKEYETYAGDNLDDCYTEAGGYVAREDKGEDDGDRGRGSERSALDVDGDGDCDSKEGICSDDEYAPGDGGDSSSCGSEPNADVATDFQGFAIERGVSRANGVHDVDPDAAGAAYGNGSQPMMGHSPAIDDGVCDYHTTSPSDSPAEANDDDVTGAYRNESQPRMEISSAIDDDVCNYHTDNEATTSQDDSPAQYISQPREEMPGADACSSDLQSHSGEVPESGLLANAASQEQHHNKSSTTGPTEMPPVERQDVPPRLDLHVKSRSPSGTVVSSTTAVTDATQARISAALEEKSKILADTLAKIQEKGHARIDGSAADRAPIDYHNVMSQLTKPTTKAKKDKALSNRLRRKELFQQGTSCSDLYTEIAAEVFDRPEDRRVLVTSKDIEKYSVPPYDPPKLPPRKRDPDAPVFKKSQKDGYYVYTSSSGNRYAGHWKDGRRHGHGTAEYREGEVFNGEWRRGRRDGRGVLHLAKSEVFDGRWEANKKHGLGIYYWVDGEVDVSWYQEDVRLESVRWTKDRRRAYLLDLETSKKE